MDFIICKIYNARALFTIDEFFLTDSNRSNMLAVRLEFDNFDCDFMEKYWREHFTTIEGGRSRLI